MSNPTIGVDPTQVDDSPGFKRNQRATLPDGKEFFYGAANSNIDAGATCIQGAQGDMQHITTARLNGAHANIGGAPVAGMSNGQWGWFQIRGEGQTRAVAVAAGGVLSPTGSGGVLDDAGTETMSGITAVEAKAAAAAGLVRVMFNYPRRIN